MEKQGWKTAAIVSTILLILVLIALGAIYFMGAVELYHEEICAHDICGLDNGTHDAFFLAPDKTCFCFEQGELNLVDDVRKYAKWK